MPASGPRLGREPAASEGSGICPGIMSNPAKAVAVVCERKEKGNRERLAGDVHSQAAAIQYLNGCKLPAKRCD